jgi:hypothetical protein
MNDNFFEFSRDFNETWIENNDISLSIKYFDTGK